MDDSKVFMFPEGASKGSIDPNLLLALNQNGGFGGGNGWYWIIFLWMMWQQNGGRGNFSDYVAQSGNEGRQYLAEIMNGRFDNLNTLAQILNTGVESVKSGIFSLQSSIQSVGTQVGMSGLEVQNAIALGNAGLAKQLCECCCENRLAIAEQTNTLQTQAASNHSALMAQNASNFAAQQLQMAQNHADDRLDVCQQTNTLQNQAERDTNTITNAIAALQTNITKEFCDIKEREMQDKINTQSDIITQLRGQLDNDRQTAQLFAAINPLQSKVNEIANKQPNTVPVEWPNLLAVNNTPYLGGFYGNNWNGSFWG